MNSYKVIACNKILTPFISEPVFDWKDYWSFYLSEFEKKNHSNESFCAISDINGNWFFSSNHYA